MSDDLIKYTSPYDDVHLNHIYELLFCDNVESFRKSFEQNSVHPWDVLLAEKPDVTALGKIAADTGTESWVRLLAYHVLRMHDQKISQQELLGVIVEVGLEEGLDVLASFKDGTARYINYTGRMIIWETSDERSAALTNSLFEASQKTLAQIGSWDKPRRSRPATGYCRISFLVSDGLYFGEGPTDVLFSDPLGSAALNAATALMNYLVETTINKEKETKKYFADNLLKLHSCAMTIQ
jgi:hypothetical protein